MKLQRQNTENPNFKKLNEMKTEMRELLDSSQTSELTLEQLIAFQDSDGSFKLFDSYKIPSDARFEYCHIPTYTGTAILMKAYLNESLEITKHLEKALQASLKSGLSGHGYESEKGRIEAMNIFIAGGIKAFLESQRDLCPEFHQIINNILHHYNLCLIQRNTKGLWREDYIRDWQSIVNNLHQDSRLYAAYGSNMDKEQMSRRCSDAKVVGTGYLDDWKLTMPFYANIEQEKGRKTPVLIWEISEENEKKLDKYEGYPKSYSKTDIITEIDGKSVSVMAYVMTEEYKTSKKKPRDGYREQILHGYEEAGFSEKEFVID